MLVFLWFPWPNYCLNKCFFFLLLRIIYPFRRRVIRQNRPAATRGVVPTYIGRATGVCSRSSMRRGTGDHGHREGDAPSRSYPADLSSSASPSQPDRQSDSQAGRQTDRQADRQAGRQTDRQTDRSSPSQPDRQTDRQSDRQTDRQTGRQTDRQVIT